MSDKINVPGLNKIIISGRLTKDAEIRYTTDNSSIITFRIAHSKRYKTRDGEWKDNTLFINVIYWGRSYAERLKERLLTGIPVIIEGELNLNTWEDRTSGEKRSSFQIRADKVHILQRSGEGFEQPEVKKNIDVDEAIEDLDKDFNEIDENENGGNDDIPF